MKIKKNILTVVLSTIAIFAVLVVSPLGLIANAAYNPLDDADKDLSNLEKARIILEYFQKSGVDSDWGYDIEKNKDVVEIMLVACVEMTDEEVSQLTGEEKLNFYAYFQKLYEVSGLDAQELGALFEIKDLEKAVDEIYHVDDKKAGESTAQPKAEGEISSSKTAAIILAIIAFCVVLSVALSKSIKRVNDK